MKNGVIINKEGDILQIRLDDRKIGVKITSTFLDSEIEIRGKIGVVKRAEVSFGLNEEIVAGRYTLVDNELVKIVE
ncbi:hypothetical protein HYV64_02135 [Candidatus Shapirobacteria bacterium]|nr:hypothetical protein [Candidatus Shapirobacteria bacterium]